MKLLQQLRNSTRSRFLLATLLASAASGHDLIENTLETGENLFAPVPLSVMAAGAGCAYLAYRTESSSGYSDFLPETPFSTFDKVDNFIFGEALPISATTLWIAGSISNSENAENTGEVLCRGLLYTYGFVQTLKLTTHRTRPDSTNTRSFPSAHVAGASCTAVVLWNRYGADVGIPFAALALYTCASRLNLGKHFPSDVVFGAAIGTACGFAAAAAGKSNDLLSFGNFSFSLSVDTEGRITAGL